MKKICIFAGYYLPHLGGIERYTDKLSEQLKKMGYEITIVAFMHEPLDSIEKKDYCTIYRLPCYKLFLSRYPILKRNKDFKKTMSLLKDSDFDFVVLQSRFFLTSLLGARFAYKLKIPCIAIEHGTNHFTVNNKILDKLGTIYEHFLTKVLKIFVKDFFGVSKACTKWLKHFEINAHGVMYNSVSQMKPIKRESTNVRNIRISYAGRLIKEKGVLELVSVFEKLKLKYKNIELYIAGNGPLYEDLLLKYKSNKDIHLLGKITYEEVMKLLAKTDIYVHPSMYPEGLPTSILEAGISRCAVVATDRGGTVEVINSKELGIIVKETERSLYKGLETLIKNPDQIKNLGENLYSRILSNFTWEITAKKFIIQIKQIERNYNEKN